MKSRNSYCICRINGRWSSIQADLEERGYSDIRAIIPTVKILRKTQAGKETYDIVPLLFNFGFIRLSRERAYNRSFMRNLASDIPGISGWVYDTVTMHPRKKKKRVDNLDIFDDFSKVAQVSRRDVRYYKRVAKRNCIYSADEITSLYPGEYITLHGYPFEGIGAIVEDISLRDKMVTVTIFPGERGSLTIQLPFSNILYSIYGDFEEDLLINSEDTIDLSQLPSREEPYEEIDYN